MPVGKGRSKLMSRGLHISHEPYFAGETTAVRRVAWNMVPATDSGASSIDNRKNQA